MIDTPAPPPGWAEAAVQAGTELGLGSAFAAMDPADRDRVCRRTGQILADQGQALPPGWEHAMTQLLGGAGSRPPADDALARDTADTVLAETGEVFAPEDDA
ncbi:hypothetical protein MKK88_03680 [Methylobacterium sp. E-005]|uniref:hypothetical protein n=1 Tax=Methylobacterium sp. E-005 TaxID=2836549 RepID=UPI001FB8B8BF|nr:hypothetical protein [Methylobacterium sp. E-005]MCJ2085094.1 hypothetical protein [Methylobacterium sp. E-005]